MKTEIERLCRSSDVQSCDAFMLFFMGFGDDGGQIFGTDDVSLSIKNDIMPNFNTSNCPALKDKPKIFCFQIAKPGLLWLLL